MDVEKWSYGEYKSKNYGVNTMALRVGTFEVFFSYNTVVAFRDDMQFVIRQNDWGSTTGKHLNWLDMGNKKARVPGAIFKEMLNDVLKKHELSFD